MTSTKPNKYSRKLPKGVTHIDVYRVLDVFMVRDPCIQHAVKKLLAPGQRGVKGEEQDVGEALDSLVRYQEMRAEEKVRFDSIYVDEGQDS